eukprot:2374433-Rhodomonas_salina.1
MPISLPIMPVSLPILAVLLPSMAVLLYLWRCCLYLMLHVPLFMAAVLPSVVTLFRMTPVSYTHLTLPTICSV